MPLSWTLRHDCALVEVKCTGPVRQRDIADYLTSMMKAGAAPYAALIDFGAAELELSSAELSTFGRQVQLPGGADAGAIAIVVSSEAEHELADYFARHARGGRLFADPAQARVWLEACRPG